MSTQKKSLLPEYKSIFHCGNQTKLTQQQKQSLSIKYYSEKPWYLSVVGICFGITAFLLFFYGVTVLSIINSTLFEGSDLNSEEFKLKYGASRGDLHNLQGIFTTIVVITSIVLFGLIWASLSIDLKCKLFNQYTAILLVLFIFIISCWVQSSVANKTFSNGIVSIINLIILIITILFILGFFFATLNHHYDFLKEEK
jgi:cytochrome bd-type quinol oxidase subunit 2